MTAAYLGPDSIWAHRALLGAGRSFVALKQPESAAIVYKKLLVASGVSYETWNPPAELSEPRGCGEPITHDDLIDFHTVLADDEALAALLQQIV